METMSLIGYKTMLAWFCAQSRLDSRLEFGFQLEASQSPGMGGRGPKKRVSAAGAVALEGDRVDAMRIVHLLCSDSGK